MGRFATGSSTASARMRSTACASRACTTTAAAAHADVVREPRTAARPPSAAPAARGVATVRAERANIDVALAWAAAHDPLLGGRIAIGFGWTWVVLGDGVAGADALRSALAAADTVPRQT